jgi:hypothetical protein
MENVFGVEKENEETEKIKKAATARTSLRRSTMDAGRFNI